MFHTRVSMMRACVAGVRSSSSVARLAATNRMAMMMMQANKTTITQRRILHTQQSLRSSSSSSSSVSSSSDLADEFANLWEDAPSTGSGSSGSGDVTGEVSTGQVIGVNMGIVSIDGLRSVHVGACVEFINPEEVREIRDKETRERERVIGEAREMQKTNTPHQHTHLKKG